MSQALFRCTFAFASLVWCLQSCRATSRVHRHRAVVWNVLTFHPTPSTPVSVPARSFPARAIWMVLGGLPTIPVTPGSRWASRRLNPRGQLPRFQACWCFPQNPREPMPSVGRVYTGVRKWQTEAKTTFHSSSAIHRSSYGGSRISWQTACPEHRKKVEIMKK